MTVHRRACTHISLENNSLPVCSVARRPLCTANRKHLNRTRDSVRISSRYTHIAASFASTSPPEIPNKTLRGYTIEHDRPIVGVRTRLGRHAVDMTENTNDCRLFFVVSVVRFNVIMPTFMTRHSSKTVCGPTVHGTPLGYRGR